MSFGVFFGGQTAPRPLSYSPESLDRGRNHDVLETTGRGKRGRDRRGHGERICGDEVHASGRARQEHRADDLPGVLRRAQGRVLRHRRIEQVAGGGDAHQLSVFGSEPGEDDYNPLWEEFFVTWKAGAKPVLLVKDDQIKALAKKGKLTLRDAHVVLNAPIVKVGK
jgi:hypothetical protein